MIQNFPIENNNRTVGLMGKMRLQVQKLSQLAQSYAFQRGYDPDKEEAHLRITELESKLVQTNVNYLKAKDLSDRLAQRMEQQKDRFNGLVKDKVKLQEELIRSETEKLKVSKKLIEV
jgi:hypothetical protein